MLQRSQDDSWWQQFLLPSLLHYKLQGCHCHLLEWLPCRKMERGKLLWRDRGRVGKKYSLWDDPLNLIYNDWLYNYALIKVIQVGLINWVIWWVSWWYMVGMHLQTNVKKQKIIPLKFIKIHSSRLQMEFQPHTFSRLTQSILTL